LNCSDANGWWITGYTGQSLASDVYNLLSPYFATTVLINSTEQLGQLLQNSLSEGDIQDAVVMNTFGECVPIPDDYCQGGALESQGYQGGSYARYFHTLGSKTRQYNWTWVSIVGYPFYYVSNTENSYLDGLENGYGIYGMEDVAQAGARAFLQGLNNQGYSYDSSGITAEKDVVQLSTDARDKCNYYGIYPDPEQTASRAIDDGIRATYNLVRPSSGTVFNPKDNYIAAATFRHQDGSGALTAIGLTRIPDIRIPALALLMYYQPRVYKSEFGASGTSRLVTLQLGQQGGT
jgi:hypothetical protein